MKNWLWMSVFIINAGLAPVQSFAKNLPENTYSELELSGAEQGPNPTLADSESKSWLDKSHAYASQSTDTLANWIDNFFGAPQSDLESAYSSLRLSFENEWKESEGNDSNVRLRGKVHLPRIDKRLSLIFTDSEDGDSNKVDTGISAVTGKKENTKVGLQYNIQDKKRSRLDFSVGLRSSFKGKANIRYRYEVPWGERFTHRITEMLYFVDGEGFGVRSRYELDRTLNKNRLLRWTNNLKFSEDTDGVAWSTRLLMGERLNEKSAVSYFVWTGGKTRPDYLTTSYGLGMRYRRTFYRPWLFYELEPAYAWEREELINNRQGVAILTARIEIKLERLHNAVTN